MLTIEPVVTRNASRNFTMYESPGRHLVTHASKKKSRALQLLIVIQRR
jgi:hypothetical protein